MAMLYIYFLGFGCYGPVLHKIRQYVHVCPGFLWHVESIFLDEVSTYQSKLCLLR